MLFFLQVVFYLSGIFFFVKGAIMAGTVKDAADAVVASTGKLVAAARAVVVFFQQNPPPDPNAQAIIDELDGAATQADTETAALNAIVNPPPPPAPGS